MEHHCITGVAILDYEPQREDRGQWNVSLARGLCPRYTQPLGLLVSADFPQSPQWPEYWLLEAPSFPASTPATLTLVTAPSDSPVVAAEPDVSPCLLRESSQPYAPAVLASKLHKSIKTPVELFTPYWHLYRIEGVLHYEVRIQLVDLLHHAVNVRLLGFGKEKELCACERLETLHAEV